MKIIKLLKRVLGIFTAFFAIIYIEMSITHDDDKPLSICLAIIMIIFTILLFRPTKKDRTKNKTKDKQQDEKSMTCTMKHINGLPIAENINCVINSLPNSFEFLSGSMKFELEKSKITDMCIKTDKEIQHQYVSSIGGAVGGAALFGPLGAIIGGRAKKKKVKKEIHYYLIITYKSEDIKYIGFEITGFSMMYAKKFINEFKNKCSKESTYKL